MSNELGMAMKQAILALKPRGWSHRRIGRELGIHRETVGRCVALAAKPASNPPLGSDANSKPANNPDLNRDRGSVCPPKYQVALLQRSQPRRPRYRA
ncbi:MAG: hypothetical protein HKL96_05340 [Phycisphaerales bacterium]|nr:hypothetical protein [Phycisphaerales bacterium]